MNYCTKERNGKHMYVTLFTRNHILHTAYVSHATCHVSAPRLKTNNKSFTNQILLLLIITFSNFFSTIHLPIALLFLIPAILKVAPNFSVT